MGEISQKKSTKKKGSFEESLLQRMPWESTPDNKEKKALSGKPANDVDNDRNSTISEFSNSEQRTRFDTESKMAVTAPNGYDESIARIRNAWESKKTKQAEYELMGKSKA